MARHIRDLGSYGSIQEVWAALPSGGQEGDYLTINGSPFAWNKFIRQWQNDTTVINNPARELQTHDGDMNIGNDARIGGNLVVIGNIINDSIKNGLSAFELAVKGGFSGSEADWLNSLIGKSAYQIWLEQAGNAGKNMTQFLAWMKDTQAIHGPKYIEDESLIDTVNDRMTLFYVPSGTSYKVVFVDEGGGTHTLANRIGDITNYAGIYDVSADNELDGGILKTYGSLPEAIADIDENAQKGGMTIKFIQVTGTNAKYVQYRYLLSSTAASDFTNEANWEGVTDTIDASDNIVTAKAVFNKLCDKTIVSLNDLTEENAFPSRQNGILIWKDKYASTPKRYGKFLPVAEGEKYLIENPHEEYNCAVIPVESNSYTIGQPIQFAGDYTDWIAISPTKNTVLSIPTGCTYLYIQITTSSSTESRIDISPIVYKTNVMADDVRIKDNIANAGSKKLITSDAVYNATHRLNAISIPTNDSQNAYIYHQKWYNTSSYYSVMLSVLAGEVYRITTAQDVVAIIAFTESDDRTIGNSVVFSNGTSDRIVIQANESLNVEVLSDCYLYVQLNLGSGDITPTIEKYTDIKEEIDSVKEKIAARSSFENIVNESITFNGDNIKIIPFTATGNRICKITLDNNSWNVSSISNSSVVFAIVDDNQTQAVYLCRITKANKDDRESNYYIIANGNYRIIGRGNIGETLNVVVSDVTDNYNRSILGNVAFVDKDLDDTSTVQESMLVKLEKGQIARYKVNVSSDFTYLKVFSRAVRNDTYNTDELTADESGVVEDLYLATDDCYIALYSEKGSGFTPTFQVFDEGDATDGVRYPYQLIFDTDNIRPIISLTDEGNHYYDNSLINYGQIIPKTDIEDGEEINRLYLLYQGYGTAVIGTDDEPVSNILMAYSEDDGETWTRGIPDGISKPYPNADSVTINGSATTTINNVIFKKGRIVGDVNNNTEVINEFAIAKVNDSQYPYRMFAAVRNGSKVDRTISGQKNYLFKSSDLVNWKVIRRITEHAHDTFSSIISYGDKMLVFIRMWDYTNGSNNGIRLIGSMWFDIEGNVIQPPSGLFGHFIYNPAATQIGVERFLFLPTVLIPTTSIMVGDNVNEAYIMDKGKVRWCPCYNIDKLKKVEDNNGWNYVTGIVAIGTKQYVLYGQRQAGHGTSTVTDGNSELRFCPVEWVTYYSHNLQGG